jgi:hypothetical protein
MSGQQHHPIAAAPAMVLDGASVVAPFQADLDRLQRSFGDQPVTLVRSAEGRDLSAFRLETAHDYFPHKAVHRRATYGAFHNAGICAQMALASHLMDVGFPDGWCAINVPCSPIKSLAYANATGLGLDDRRMRRLARVLSPYWKWQLASVHMRRTRPRYWGFEPDEVRCQLGMLLKQVRLVTGHTADAEMLLREAGDA